MASSSPSDPPMTDDLVGRLRRDGLKYQTDTFDEAAARIEALEAENRKLREAIKPFADCADQLDGSEWTPRAPDGEWARFRLLTDDYRAARAALTPEPPHAD